MCRRGSNFSGLSFPMIGKRLRGEGFEKTEFIAVESKASPKMTKGSYRYEFGDTAGYLPMFKMYTIGRDFVPPLHAAGLRYYAVAPILSLLIHEGVRPAAYGQEEVFESVKVFAKTEGIIPAHETAHAIKGVIDEAVKCRRRNLNKVILFCLSGHGLLDLQAYEGAR